MKTVLIADNHPMMRKGLREAVDADERFSVVGEVGDTEACLFQVEQQSPDLLILDLNMPTESGFDVLVKMRQRRSPTRVIVFSMHASPEFVSKARELGAKAFVAKEDVGDELIEILADETGGFRMSSSAGRPEVNLPLEEGDLDEDVRDLLSGLTQSELRILKEMASNKTSRQIGMALGISPRTVQAHRLNITKKFDIHGANALLRFVVAHRRSIINF